MPARGSPWWPARGRFLLELARRASTVASADLSVSWVLAIMRTGGADPQKPQCRRGGWLPAGGRHRVDWPAAWFPFPAVGFPMCHSEPIILTPADGVSK